MSSAQFLIPYQAATVAGLVLPGAKAYFYDSGTTTKEVIYSDAGLTTPLTNPVTSNGAGMFPTIYLDISKSYRLVIKDKNDADIGCDIDPYLPGTLGTGSLVASSRAAMSALSNGSGIPAILWEGVRHGIYLPMSAATYASITGRTLTTDVPIDGGNLIVPYSGDPTGASGAWVYPYWMQDVSVRMFGAVDGTTDVKTPIEAWANAVWQLPCKSASCRVSGSTALPLTVGASSGCKTKLLYFGPTINATATMDILVTIQNVGGVHINFEGCTLYGSASTSVPQGLSNRLASYGLRITNAQYMTSTGRVQINNCYHWGGLLNDSAAQGPNSNYAQLPLYQVSSCGVSKDAGGVYGMTSNWSTPVKSGGTGSISQTTKINVDTIPRTDNICGNFGWLFWIAGYPYSVSGSVASGDPTYPYTLTLQEPWIDDTSFATGSGTGQHTLGGKFLGKGTDSGMVRILGIEGNTAGYCLLDGTQYGLIVERLDANSSEDVWYGFGQPGNSAKLGGKIISGYIETGTCPAQVLSLGATASSLVEIGVINGVGVNFSKWFKHGPRANVGGDDVDLYDQVMDEIVRVAGYDGKRIVAGTGPNVSVTYDPPSIASGSSVTTSITIPGGGVSVGDPIRVTFNKTLSGLTVMAYVHSVAAVVTSTVKVVFSNLTGAAVDLPSGTLTITLLRP